MEKLDRPEVLTGKTVKIQSGCGSMYVTLNYLDGKLFEVFAFAGKSGAACIKGQLEALTRSLTTGLRCGVPVEMYIEELKDIRCPQPGDYFNGSLVLSCADAVAKVLKDHSGYIEPESEMKRRLKDVSET